MPQVDHLWFNDGNVVLQAGDHLFCLHNGFLSARSQVFRHLLEDRNYDAVYGVSRDVDINGRVLIRIPDSPQDALYFFLALYGVGASFATSFFEPPPARVSIDVVLGILRMSTAYHVPALRRRALAHLHTAYPLTLAGWDQRAERTTIREPRHSYAAAGPVASTFASAFAVLRTVQQVHAPWLLPVAFYNCCSSHLDVIMDHFSRLRRTGNTLRSDGEGDGDTNTDTDTDTDDMQEVQNAIIRGAFAHLEATRELLAFLFLPPADGCATPSECLEKRRECTAHIYASYPGNDPLAVWEDKDDWVAYHLGDMCPACTRMCSAAHHRERESFWDGLPEVYGINQGWEDLEELYNREMGVE